MPPTFRLKQQKQKQLNRIDRRIKLMACFMVLLALILMGQLTRLQYFDQQHYNTLSNNNHLTMLPIEPPRGLITDRHGVVLANNQAYFSLNLIPEFVKNFNATRQTLSHLISISESDIRHYKKGLRSHKKYQAVELKAHLDEKEVATYYVNQYRLPGVVLRRHMKRVYPFGRDFSHTIGYTGRLNDADSNRVNPDNYTEQAAIGKTGLEYQFETELHGEMGYHQVEIDASGHLLRTIKTIEPKPGKPLQLTLDAKLQHLAHQELRNREGAIVVLDVATGGILAMASEPSYDPNDFARGISNKAYRHLLSDPNKPLFDRSIQGVYAPGSTLKPFIAFGALDDGTINAQTMYDDHGTYHLPHNTHLYHDWNWYNGGHGRVNVSTALIVSCDTFFYHLSHLMGIRRLYHHLSQFQFGQKTGVELPNESAGILPNPAWKQHYRHEPWYGGDTVIMSIGQGFFLSTPLQLARATLIFAGHGSSPPVTLRMDQANQSKAITHIHAHQPIHWQTLDHALEQVINSVRPRGTGGSFGRNPPYRVAAKTGTTQVYAVQHQNLHGMVDQSVLPKKLRDHALFIAYTPTNKAKIVVAVIVEHDYTFIAAQIARKITNAYDHIEGLR